MPTLENKDQKTQSTPRDENNARSVDYLLIALSSLINLSSIANLKKDALARGNKQVGICFSAVTLGASLLILVVDRAAKSLDYTKAAEGKLEGLTLIFFTAWWTIGVGYLTQVQGIAYSAINVYASSWFTWVLCIQTLNKWSASKDILTINELTGISETLKSWYVVALGSMVVMGSSVDFWFKAGSRYSDDAVFSFCLSTFCTLLCLGWILTHMNFITCCQEGGWLEAGSAWILIATCIVNCAVLTRDGGIGATVTGSRNYWDSVWQAALDDSHVFEQVVDSVPANCSLSWSSADGTQSSVSIECPEHEGIPGSNLYVAIWVSLFGSVSISLRWNAQRARSLIPTRGGKTMVASNTKRKENSDDDDLNELDISDTY